jgi:hypothetical protein
VLFAIFGGAQFTRDPTIMVLAFMPVVLVAPLLAVSAFQQSRAAKRYRGELERGRVWRFERASAQLERGFVDEAQLVLVRKILKREAPNDLTSLSVLPLAREVLSVNDTFAREGMRAELVAVAAPPTSAWKVDVQKGLIAIDGVVVDPVTSAIRRRRFTQDEISELRAKVAQLRRLSWGFWFLTALTAAVFLLWRSNGYPIPPKPITQILPMGLWLYTMIEVIRNQWFAWRLSLDAKEGWVITLDGIKPTEASLITSTEILAVSNASWTVEGEAAMWRTSKRFHTLLIDRGGRS